MGEFMVYELYLKAVIKIKIAYLKLERRRNLSSAEKLTEKQ